MTRDELIAKAEEHGVEIDKRWNMDRISDEMKRAGVATEESDLKPFEKKDGTELPEGVGMAGVPVLLKKDIWISGARTKKGAVVTIPTPDAKKLIENGAAERADPLPGEN